MPSEPATQPKSPTAGILKFPLAPGTLTQMDKLSAFPAGPFDPDAATSHFYRYDVCGGRLVLKYNPAMGWLHLARSGSSDAVTLTVEDHLQFEGSQQHRKAKIRYGREGVARPTGWEYEVRYFNQLGNERTGLTVREQAIVNERWIRVSSNGKTVTRPCPADLTCSWGGCSKRCNACRVIQRRCSGSRCSTIFRRSKAIIASGTPASRCSRGATSR